MTLYWSPQFSNEKYFFGNLSLVLTKRSCKYENIMLTAGLDLTFESKNLRFFMNTFEFGMLN